MIPAPELEEAEGYALPAKAPPPRADGLRDYQREADLSIEAGWAENETQLVTAATGCFARGTPVLMANGEIKPVEMVRVGNAVMGPDGLPRTVRSLARGRQMMYAITPTKGSRHIVNEGHILTCVLTPARPGGAAPVRDMRLMDYIASGRTTKHRAKLYRSAALEFWGQMEFLPLPAYYVGIYLGDGSANGMQVTTMDQEIADEVRRVAESFGLKYRVSDNMIWNRSKNHHITGPITGRGTIRNGVTQAIRALGIAVHGRDKFIPHAYKTASIENRLEVLAGLMDTDGSRANGGYDYISQSQRLAEDVAFVARSLGLAAYVAPCWKSCQTGAVGLYHRVSISGDCGIIPCRLERKKQLGARRQKKSVLRTGFTVTKLGVDKYFGFTLEGPNGRFLLGDFTATHNTGKTVTFSAVVRRNFDKGGRTLILCHMDELIEQARDKIMRMTQLPAAKEKAEHRALLSDRVVVGSIQTLARDTRLERWPKNHFSLIVGDEAHLHLAPGWQKVLTYFRSGGARILGVTATADRGDKKELGNFYQRLAYDYPLIRACKDGWLVRPMVKTMQLEIDIRTVKATRTPDGSDMNPTAVAHILEPFLAAIAAEIWKEASSRKILVFMPSIDTAEKMARAMSHVGFRAEHVSGACQDRHAKIERFRRNETRVLCNAQLLSTGFDCDDIDVIVPLRPTKIRSLFVQICGRGTRPLTSLVPALAAAADAEERCRLIAKSAKPNVLILDPLWLHEQHDLTAPSCLVTRNEEEAEQMKGVQGDLILAEEAVAKDFLENLRKGIAKHRNRRAAMVDPLSLAVAIGDSDLANYEPQSLWDLKDPTAEQLKILEDAGVETDKVRWRGQAEKLLAVITGRKDRGLCTVRMMNWLKRRGIDATLMRHEDAVAHQRKLFANGFRD